VGGPPAVVISFKSINRSLKVQCYSKSNHIIKIPML